MEKKRPTCSKCQHYFITWDQKAPHGCRLYQLKSAQEPSKIVYQAGMGDCQGFKEKVLRKAESTQG